MGYKYRQDGTPDFVNSEDSNSTAIDQHFGNDSIQPNVNNQEAKASSMANLGNDIISKPKNGLMKKVNEVKSVASFLGGL